MTRVFPHHAKAAACNAQPRGSGTLSVVIPVRTVSEMNARGHWRIRANRFKNQRLAVLAGIGLRGLPPLPARVVITRIGKRLLDSDNLAGSAKAIRDEVAARYGVDDGSPLYEWVYCQEIGKEFAIRIDITPAPPAKETT